MFGKMKIYTVHIKPERIDAYELPVFVREGINIWAFLFPLFWALYERLWLYALLVLGVEFSLVMIGSHHYLSAPSIGIMQLGFHLFVALQANDWRRAAFANRGYITADIVSSDSLLRAEQRYFERYVAA